MGSPSLSSVPADRRQRAARSAALLAVVMVAVFAVAWLRPAPGVVRLFATVALLGAVLLGLISWGLRTSVRQDADAARLDATLAEAAAGAGCSCGHDHDPDELHVTDAGPACGNGPACDHSCAECVLTRQAERDPR
jgi:hypothetical protein